MPAVLRVFLTGATGYLGEAIATRLLRAGHEVRALARSLDRARRVEEMGARIVPGRLQDLDTIVDEMKNCDAVVHAAVDDSGAEAADASALAAVRAAAQDGRVRRLLYTSGIWVHGDTGGVIVDEASPLAPADLVRWRPAHEQAALDLAQFEVAAVVLRPGMVYGGAGGTMGEWFQEAREKGTVHYPGDGRQRWGIVHRDDMADAYALALEHAHGGERFLLVDGSRLTVRELAEAAARAAGARPLPTDALALRESEGAFGAALLMDQQFTAARARRELGWVPRHVGFVAEATALLREWELATAAAAN